jgi:hypothetical protein
LTIGRKSVKFVYHGLVVGQKTVLPRHHNRSNTLSTQEADVLRLGAQENSGSNAWEKAA